MISHGYHTQYGIMCILQQQPYIYIYIIIRLYTNTTIYSMAISNSLPIYGLFQINK